MDIKTKWEKTKKWASRNAEPLLAVGAIGSVVAFSVWFSKAVAEENRQAIANYNAWADDMNQWVDEEREAGNAIYPLIDGTYLVASEDLNLQVVEK